MRRAIVLASPFVAALALFACEDSGSGGGTGGFTTEAGTFEAGPPSEGGAVKDGALDAPVAPKSVTVGVVRGLGPAVGATVVFHDAAGAVLESKVTGADGRATSSDGVAPAQASLLLGAGGNRHVITWTAVEPGDVLLARDDDNGIDPGGSFNVVTQGNFADGGAVTLTASVGDCTGFSPSSPIPVFVGSSCTRPTAAVLARAFGPVGNNSVLAYAFAKGKPPVPTDAGVGSVAVGPWLGATSVKVTPKNLPSQSSASAVLYEIADGLGILNETGSVTRIDPATTYLVAPGFADAYQAGGRMSPNSALGSVVTIARRSAPAATNDIDFTGAPPAIDSATLDTTTIARPSAAWTTLGGASLATMDGGAIVVSWYDQRESSGTWTFVVPPGSKSVKAPAMPNTAEPWLPHGANDAGAAVTFQDPMVIFAEADILPGYADFRKGIGLVIPLTDGYQPDARAILPANGTIKLTSYRNLPTPQ